MAVSVTIRNVPDETRNELAARAAASGRSLQEYLRLQLIALAERPDPEALRARIRERKARIGKGPTTEEILRYIKEERR
jgi:plasmid stability protein